MDIDALLSSALTLHRSGRLDDAESIYRLALDARPGDPDALQLLATLVSERGRTEEALSLLGQAIEADPTSPLLHAALGLTCIRSGMLPDAIRHYQEALRLEPSMAEVRSNLGHALLVAGDLIQAEAELRATVTAKPSLADAHLNLGLVLQEQGRAVEAEEALLQALAARPDYVEALSNLAGLRLERGEVAEAIELLTHAVDLDPDSAALWDNLAVALHAAGDHDRALACFEQALRHQGNSARTWGNIGNLLRRLNRFADAIPAFGRALALVPNDPLLLSNFGATLLDLRQFDTAERCFRHAAAQDSHCVEAHWNLAVLLLTKGRLVEGFSLYEWRWHLKNRLPRAFAARQWQGERLDGTLLVHAEQGFGDTLQFARYLALAAGQVECLVFECQPSLVELMRSAAGPHQVIARGDELPDFDCHVPLLSLPGLLSSTLDDVPAQTPYLRADAVRREAWRARLGEAQGLRVGLAWAGNPDHDNDHNRSIALPVMQPLLDVPGVRWISLQLGGSKELAELAGDIFDAAPHLSDFSETAALVAELDMIVTVDSALAHLAGALGKPVWVMLPVNSCWRWHCAEDSVAWYPNARLFRQPDFGLWLPVIERLAAELRHLTTG